jgi:ubiquinone/menaquinone biosynthesis C-methylase UbiE
MPERPFQPGSINYDGAIASNYAAARSLSDETASVWTAVVEPFIKPAHPATILDLGCGTGRFSALFAERFDARVIGLDPAVAMLRAAAQGEDRDNVFYAAARSEQLPLGDCCCDLAWLSQMIHHVRDRDACAHELQRVLRRGGHVLIRGAFADRLDGFPAFLRFFPGARSIMMQFPTTDQVQGVFRTAGFLIEEQRRVPQRSCSNLAELAERTRLRADSTLSLLRDAEFEQCQANLERAAREEPAAPVIETLDLLIFKKTVA